MDLVLVFVVVNIALVVAILIVRFFTGDSGAASKRGGLRIPWPRRRPKSAPPTAAAPPSAAGTAAAPRRPAAPAPRRPSSQMPVPGAGDSAAASVGSPGPAGVAPLSHRASPAGEDDQQGTGSVALPGAAAAAPAPVATEDVAERPEPVWLGVSCPGDASPGDRFAARFAAYAGRLEAEVRDVLAGLSPGVAPVLRAQACRWKPGTTVIVRPSGRGFTFDPPEDAFVWDGERAIRDFEVTADPAAGLGRRTLRLDAIVVGASVARVVVSVEIVPASRRSAAPAVARAKAAGTAFASYASADRERVLDRIAAVRDVTGMDVFLDCLSLHPGERWKTVLAHEIRGRDLFLLFWSAAARASPWVEWEWREALAARGLDGIQPQPLEDASRAPPPPELQELHFGDPLLALRERPR